MWAVQFDQTSGEVSKIYPFFIDIFLSFLFIFLDSTELFYRFDHDFILFEY